MPLWLSIALPFAAVVLTVVLNAVVNTKIKFASSQDEVKGDLKKLALWVTLRIINLLSIGSIIYCIFLDISRSEPLTRVAIYIIAYNVAALLFQVMLLVIEYLITQIRNQIYNDIKGICGDIRELAGIASDLNNIQGIHFSLTTKITETLVKPSGGEPD